jgi:predicted nucleotidyltransferase
MRTEPLLKKETTSAGLAETLFGEYRRRVLALLLLRPDEEFHVREISRLTSVPVGSLHRELKTLAEAGLVSRQTFGNQVHYRVSRDCPIFQELASILRKTSGMADVLRQALLPLAGTIDFAFVFGSVARGEEKRGSDVDVFVVGSASFAEVVLALAEKQADLGRDINPVVMGREEFLAKLGAGEHFVSRVLGEPKIFLMGSENDLGKPEKP